MGRMIRSAVVGICIGAMSASSAWADRYGHHGGDSRGWWGPALFFGTVLAIAASNPPPVYYPAPVYLPPSPAPQSYVQQPAVIVQTVPTAESVPQQNWWYYCGRPAGYFPNVKACPMGWTRVSPVPPDIR